MRAKGRGLYDAGRAPPTPRDLHAGLVDDSVADSIDHTRAEPDQNTVAALMRWAHLQAIPPTERAKNAAMKAKQAADHANGQEAAPFFEKWDILSRAERIGQFFGNGVRPQPPF